MPYKRRTTIKPRANSWRRSSMAKMFTNAWADRRPSLRRPIANRVNSFAATPSTRGSTPQRTGGDRGAEPRSGRSGRELAEGAVAGSLPDECVLKPTRDVSEPGLRPTDRASDAGVLGRRAMEPPASARGPDTSAPERPVDVGECRRPRRQVLHGPGFQFGSRSLV